MKKCYIKWIVIEELALSIIFISLWHFTKWKLMDMISFCFFCAIIVCALIFLKNDKEKKEKTREMENRVINNIVELRGEIEEEFVFSHEVFGEGFYETKLCVNRDSGAEDHIPICVSERLIKIQNSFVGTRVYIEGQFRSYNLQEGKKNRLMLCVFAKEFEIDDSDFKDENRIYLQGYLCKEPTYRYTPLKREITDILLAVNRSYSKSDYIPCILWGRNARFGSEQLTVGEKIELRGRIQSREYRKKLSDVDFENRIAYEVSVHSVEKAEDQDAENED